MNKPLLGLIVGAVLGVFDGLSALVSAPEVAPQIVGIIVGSTFKGTVGAPAKPGPEGGLSRRPRRAGGHIDRPAAGLRLRVVELAAPQAVGHEVDRDHHESGGDRRPARDAVGRILPPPQDDDGRHPGQPHAEGLVVGQVGAERPARPVGPEGVLLDDRAQHEPAQRDPDERHPRVASGLGPAEGRGEGGPDPDHHRHEHRHDVRDQHERRHVALEAHDDGFAPRDPDRPGESHERDVVLELPGRGLGRQEAHQRSPFAGHRDLAERLARQVAAVVNGARHTFRRGEAHHERLTGDRRAQQPPPHVLPRDRGRAATRVGGARQALPHGGGDHEEKRRRPEKGGLPAAGLRHGRKAARRAVSPPP